MRLFYLSFFTVLLAFSFEVNGLGLDLDLVTKEERKSIVETEYGEISAVDVRDESTRSGSYHLQFFTLEPNALFLPVMLHADMLLHVKTGSGTLYWTPGDEDAMTVSLQKGDIYRMPPGSIFFLKSDLQPERQKLRIHAIFANYDDELRVSTIGAYSSITEMVRGFDKNILQAAFKAPEEVIEAVMNSSGPAIVHAASSPKEMVQSWNWEISFLKAFRGGRAYSYSDIEPEFENKKKKKQKGARTFNVLKEKPDFQNCNGWSLTVTNSDLPSLKQSNFGVFYVNLTKGSMMGPHWNPQASEIAMVVEGQGMVRVVCANGGRSETQGCSNTSFRVKEGDVFVVPRFHPMAQMSFNNDSLVLIGFTTSSNKNYPQFLAGKASVLQVIDKGVLATAFNISNTTITQLLAPQAESVILECTSCAEDEEMKMEEEIEKERERQREREEEEARKREEEEKERREQEEKEQEERRREEEATREREEAKRERREEEKRRREEEAERERREEEKRRREEEAEREREETERKRQEEEAERKRQEEEAQKEREEEEAHERERQEQEAQRERKEEEAREREREQEGKEGEKGRGETEEEAARRQEEERIRREQEEEEKREQEEKAHEREGQEEEAREREGQEQEAQRERKEEEAREREREQEGKEGKKERGETEEEAARRQEEERIRREQEEEEKREHEEGGGDARPEGEGRRVLWKV